MGNWDEELEERIGRIVDRRKSTVHGREEDLAVYAHILRHRYSEDIVSKRSTEILTALAKSIRSSKTEVECVATIKALAITVITSPHDEIDEICRPSLKEAIFDTEYTSVKCEAINALALVIFFGGASVEGTESTMAYLQEIVDSDGAYIGAEDMASVVIAALNAYGFLATQMEDMEDASQDALETFADQLGSNEARVQVSAGENIALLFEKSYTELESDEELSDDENDDDEHHGSPMVQRYEPYRQKRELIVTLQELSKVSGKGISKQDRKSLHTNFADILQTVENPTRGPRYSTALKQDSDQQYGSRLTVKVSKTTSMKIDQWWKLHRLKALRKVLQGGFLEHYQKNECVLETLPVMVKSS